MNGTLTACVDQRISLICSHDNVNILSTRWIASPPVDCLTAVSHIGPNPPTPPPCGPFTFEGITPEEPAPSLLNSTAVATTTVNMSNTTIECRGGSSRNFFSVGNISLCVVGKLYDNYLNSTHLEYHISSKCHCSEILFQGPV